MITKKQAKELTNKKIEEEKIAKEKLVEDFCETTASPIIEASAMKGENAAIVGCNSNYAHDIANYIRSVGGFTVRIDTINSKNSNLLVRWVD